MTDQQKAIHALDAVFSVFIRLTFSDDMGICRCITCGKAHYYLNLDCGHYISRREIGTRFEIKNARPQCTNCNRTRGGEPQTFALKLVEIYGSDILQELNTLSKATVKYTTNELKLLTKFYRDEIKRFKAEKSL